MKQDEATELIKAHPDSFSQRRQSKCPESNRNVGPESLKARFSVKLHLPNPYKENRRTIPTEKEWSVHIVAYCNLPFTVIIIV